MTLQGFEPIHFSRVAPTAPLQWVLNFCFIPNLCIFFNVSAMNKFFLPPCPAAGIQTHSCQLVLSTPTELQRRGEGNYFSSEAKVQWPNYGLNGPGSISRWFIEAFYQAQLRLSLPLDFTSLQKKVEENIARGYGSKLDGCKRPRRLLQPSSLEVLSSVTEAYRVT